MNEPKEREILYQGLDWHIGVDGCYINTKEKEPILNHLYEVALACKSKSEQLKAKEQECERLKNEYWKLEQGNDFLAEKNSRLMGCITEIKEIVQNNIDCKEFMAIQCMLIGCVDDKNKALQQILQKISEVEDVPSNSK